VKRKIVEPFGPVILMFEEFRTFEKLEIFPAKI